MIDLGTGNNNKMYASSAFTVSCSDSFFAETGLWIVNKRCAQFYVFLDVTHDLLFQLIDIVETVYRGASKGRGLVVSPKGRLDATFNSTGTHLSIRLFNTIQILSARNNLEDVGSYVLALFFWTLVGKFAARCKCIICMNSGIN